MKSCSWWLASDPGCAHLAVRITRAEKVGSSRQAKPREGSFWRQWKVTFLIFLPKPSFRKITLWCLFLVTLSSVRSCELYLPFIWHWLLSFPRHLSRRAGVSRSVATAGAPRWPPPAQPSLASRYQHRFCQEGRRLCTFTVNRIVQPFAFWHFSLFTEALARPRANVEPSLEGLLEGAGCEAAGRRRRQGTPSQGDRGLLWLRLLECLTRQFFGRTSSHHSYFYFFHFCYIHIY